MTARYELRQVNPKFIDIHIAGIPSSAGCEARVPVREGREHAAREFAAHLVNLLNHDVIEQARRANGAQALSDFARKAGMLPAHDAETRWQQC